MSFSPISSPSFLPILAPCQRIPETGSHLSRDAFLVLSHTALSLAIPLPLRIPLPRKTSKWFKHLIPAQPWTAERSALTPSQHWLSMQKPRDWWARPPMPCQPLAQPAAVGAGRDYFCVQILFIKLIACLCCLLNLLKGSRLLFART